MAAKTVMTKREKTADGKSKNTLDFREAKSRRNLRRLVRRSRQAAQ